MSLPSGAWCLSVYRKNGHLSLSEVMVSWPGQGEATLSQHWLGSLLGGAAWGLRACLGPIIPVSLAGQLGF